MRAAPRLGAFVVLALLAGCSTLNSLNPFAKSSGPKPAELPPLTASREVRVLWTANVGGADKYVFSPAVVGEAVYAAARDGTVVRLQAASGQQVWRASAETRLSAGAGAGDKTVAVATEEGEVIALDAQSGAVRWRSRVSSEVLAAPAVGNGLVIVRSIDSRVFAFGEEDGKRRWVHQRGASPLMLRIPAGVRIDGESAFTGFSGGRLAALALSNGGTRWEAAVANPKGATELERVTDVVGNPSIQGKEVCVAAYQGRVGCFETTTGRQLWAKDLSSLTGVGTDARYAYASDDKGAVHALDIANGRSAWKQDRLTLRQVSQPLPFGTAVVVGDYQGFVHVLARDSGAFAARHATSGGAIRAAPVALPAGVLVQTENGGLVALGL